MKTLTAFVSVLIAVQSIQIPAAQASSISTFCSSILKRLKNSKPEFYEDENPGFEQESDEFILGLLVRHLEFSYEVTPGNPKIKEVTCRYQRSFKPIEAWRLTPDKMKDWIPEEAIESFFDILGNPAKVDGSKILFAFRKSDPLPIGFIRWSESDGPQFHVLQIQSFVRTPKGFKLLKNETRENFKYADFQ